jgi:hypothetical protein
LASTPHRTGKVARLTSVEHRDRKPFRLQRRHTRHLIAATGFHHYQVHLRLAQAGRELLDSVGVVREATGVLSPTRVQPRLGDINTRVDARHRCRVPILCMHVHTLTTVRDNDIESSHFRALTLS